jgi:hypothetical protein
VVTSTDPALTEATGDRALHLPVTPGLWVEAISGALDRRASHAPTPTRRTWDDVARETVQAVLGE